MESRPATPCINWQTRRAAIADGVLDLYLEKPWPNVSIDDIAERLGTSYWKIYYSFDGQEDIYRAAINRLVDTITNRDSFTAHSKLSVSQSIQEYIRYAAGIVGSDEYRKLLFLCLRDQHTNPFVKAAYNQKIAEPLCQGLENTIAQAGSRNGLDLYVLHGERDAYLTRLEATLALPKLLGRDNFPNTQFENTVATTAKQVFAATCTFDGFGDSNPDRRVPAAA
ncbi:TetR/AcrR family transcriptional regulator [Parasphingopyxis lamellibrachiae]|uniref:TetR family transcriptional regulator n=1 Tax=Parasphingopyxis lamellibrachiae TaxID=680125 RepID=A0A3D9FEU4_9SPHN|nr:TetR family transcriptional regulator [Parasphingopyxis lamellibrachiae]RED16309.1 TetR family transcriptional regulator [Parasphingopyxis lamellibrachiae]